MKSVERLKGEHELIERGLGLLERAVARIEAFRCYGSTSSRRTTAASAWPSR
jgi:hypothetical protein